MCGALKNVLMHINLIYDMFARLNACSQLAMFRAVVAVVIQYHSDNDEHPAMIVASVSAFFALGRPTVPQTWCTSNATVTLQTDIWLEDFVCA